MTSPPSPISLPLVDGAIAPPSIMMTTRRSSGVGRPAGVVVEPARVHQEMTDPDRVHVVAAVAEDARGRGGEAVDDRVAEVNVFVTLAIRNPAFGCSASPAPSASW